MPYKRVGKTIYVYKNGKWQKKQTCKTVDKAKAALRILNEKYHKEGK